MQLNAQLHEKRLMQKLACFFFGWELISITGDSTMTH